MYPLLKIGYQRLKAKIKDKKEKPPLPDFDIGEEYVEIIYRQFVLYNAQVAFPLSTLLNFVASIVEYWLDKVRMLKFSKEPEKTYATKSVQILLAVGLSVIAILSAVNPG